VIEYVLRRLKDIGIDAIFGVPGDFAFPVQDAIVNHAGIEWIGAATSSTPATPLTVLRGFAAPRR
jgi:indolepyruvate decarboxylase